MAMTRQEAEQFIEEAERLPVDQIDAERLAEAIEVLGETGKLDVGPIKDVLVAMGADLARTGGQIGAGASAVGEALRRMAEWFDKSGEREEEKAERPGKRESFDIVERAARLAVRVVNQSTTARDQRAIAGALPEQARRAQSRPWDTTRGGSAARLPSDLRARLLEAADNRGIPRSEVDQVIADAQTQASGGLPPEMAAAFAESGQIPPDTPTVEDILEAQIAEWQSGAIGVEEGFVAQRTETLDPADRKFFGGAPTQTRDVLPKYFVGDQANYAGLPAEEITRIQKRLEAAGLIGEGTPGGAFYPGIWDVTIDGRAMLQVMGNANASGLTVDAMLDSMIANVPDSVKEARNAAKLAEQFQAPAFIKPDYASLAQDVKAYTRQRLGREPTADELAELTGFMSGLYRQDYEAEVAALRAEFEAGRQSLETGTFVAPAETGDIDPAARALEEADRRFGPDLRFLENQEDTFEASQVAMRSLMGLSNLIGGR